MIALSHRVTELYIASPYRPMEWLLLAVSPQVGLINPDIIHFHGQRSHSLLLVNRSSLGASAGGRRWGGCVNTSAPH